MILSHLRDQLRPTPAKLQAHDRSSYDNMGRLTSGTAYTFPVTATNSVGTGPARRVREGTLSWQFPAGEVEFGETFEAAASRETSEEVGLGVAATAILGERVHPATGRHMVYLACRVVRGTPRVTDADELAELAWCRLDELADYIPHGVFEPVQAYLEAELSPAMSAEPGDGDQKRTGTSESCPSRSSEGIYAPPSAMRPRH